jgi:hypothetical protein
VPDPVTVKLEPSIEAGFIGLLKTAVTIELGHAAAAPLIGATELTVGGVTVGLLPLLSGSLQAAPTISNRNVMKQIVRLLTLDMTVIFCPLGLATASR